MSANYVSSTLLSADSGEATILRSTNKIVNRKKWESLAFEELSGEKYTIQWINTLHNNLEYGRNSGNE